SGLLETWARPQTVDFVIPPGRDFQRPSTSFQLLLMARQFSARRVEIPTNPFLAPAGTCWIYATPESTSIPTTYAGTFMLPSFLASAAVSRTSSLRPIPVPAYRLAFAVAFTCTKKFA